MDASSAFLFESVYVFRDGFRGMVKLLGMLEQPIQLL